MSHGFMGVGKYGWLCTAGFTGFFAFLYQSFKGPDRPKFLLDREFIEMAKETQPGIVVDHYDKALFKASQKS